MKTFNLTFAAMRDKFIRAASGDTSFFSRDGNRKRYAKLENDWNRMPDWYGGTLADMMGYFREGFQVSALEGVEPSALPVRKRARPRFNDCEGDFRYDLFISGDDNYHVEWSKRESIPGITVEFSTGFLADVPAKTIADYMRFVCRALLAIETAGIDAAIYATSYGVSRFETSREDLKWRMEVKREGERTDYLTWSALFSPGSYRQLGFFTLCLAADELGETVSSGFGSTRADNWGVNWNAETRTLEISHVSQSYGAREFPEQSMTEQLITALQSARGN